MTDREYITIPYRIFKALAAYKPKQGEWYVILDILGLTYEDYKLRGEIPIKKLASLTLLSIREVIRILQDLEAKKMIIITRNPGKPNVIKFEKNPEKWVVTGKFIGNVEDNQRRNKEYMQKITKALEDDLKE